MNYFLAQIVLAARNIKDNDAGWMQMLVVVIFVVIYALGSIIKAKANRVEQEDEEREQPGPKPLEGARGLPKQPLQWARRPAGPAPRKRIARARAAAQKEALQVPESPLPRPQLQPEFQELPEFTGETAKELEDKYISIPAETPQAKYLSEILLDYADPDELKRAILHHEILGKPLSLRSPLEHIIGP